MSLHGKYLLYACWLPIYLSQTNSNLAFACTFISTQHLSMSQSVTGKTAIVTGAGSGINLAFASSLLAKGCNVVLADLALRPEAQKLLKEHQKDTKPDSHGIAVFQETDVRDWLQLERMFTTAQQHFDRIDIVCPGAGVYEPVSSHPDLISINDLVVLTPCLSLSATFGTPLGLQQVAIPSRADDMPSLTSTWSILSALLSSPFPTFSAPKTEVIRPSS
jgi:NAD(P)-dependent dehydrogenase (short-subunit alcohol dehydrogenase family)